jgi:non-canonical (house-cleaning) NTP pyrophosphatase
MAFAWMSVIRTATGHSSDARSATLPLPDAIKRLIDQGMELGDANDQVFATENSKQAGGAFGLLTDGLYTRESIYAQTLVLALLPLVKKIYQ